MGQHTDVTDVDGSNTSEVLFTKRYSRSRLKKPNTISIAVDTLDLQSFTNPCNQCSKYSNKKCHNVSTDTQDINLMVPIVTRNVSLDTSDLAHQLKCPSTLLRECGIMKVSGKVKDVSIQWEDLCNNDQSLVDSKHDSQEESTNSIRMDRIYDDASQSFSNSEDHCSLDHNCTSGSDNVTTSVHSGCKRREQAPSGMDTEGNEVLMSDINQKDYMEDCGNENAKTENDVEFDHKSAGLLGNGEESLSSDSSIDETNETSIERLQVFDESRVIATSSIKVSKLRGVKYYCFKCSEVFPKRHLILSHVESHHSIQPFSCITCGQATSTDNDARKHYSVHHKKAFNSAEPMSYLGGENIAIVPHPCNRCNKKFCSPATLAQHIQTHINKDEVLSNCFDCSQCDETFISLADLQRHKRLSHSFGKDKQMAHINSSNNGKLGKASRNLICLTCGKKFGTSKALREHEVVHTGAREFACNICGKAFGTPANMRIHRRTHSDKRPYSCTTCGSTFRQKDSLKVHERKHTGERPYVCSTCNMTFDRGFTLRNHMLTHVEQKSFVCAICGKAFSTRGGLNNHERLHLKDDSSKKEHGPRAKPGTGNWICDECGKIYSTRSNLKMHQRTHQSLQVSHPCPLCAKVYKSRDSMEVHMRRHNEERPFKCTTCSRSFFRNYTLKLHMLTHTGEKPHCCPIDGCNKSFAQTSSLSYHLRNHNKQEDSSESNWSSKHHSKKKLSDLEHFSNQCITSNSSVLEHEEGDSVSNCKSLGNSNVETSPDLKLLTQNGACINVLNNGTENSQAQSISGSASHMIHPTQVSSPLVWEDNLVLVSLMNSVQQSSTYHSVVDHSRGMRESSLSISPHHEQEGAGAQAGIAQLTQMVQAESLPLLSREPSIVLFTAHGAEGAIGTEADQVAHLS